jgi:hypothetical protein
MANNRIITATNPTVRKLALPVAITAAVVWAGLTLVAPAHPQPTPTPAPTQTPTLQEDDPGWNCAVHGNGSCDPASSAAAAWQAWDASRNALELGNQPTRVEYVGPSDVHVDGHMLVDGYLFRIIYPTI